MNTMSSKMLKEKQNIPKYDFDKYFLKHKIITTGLEMKNQMLQ